MHWYLLLAWMDFSCLLHGLRFGLLASVYGWMDGCSTKGQILKLICLLQNGMELSFWNFRSDYATTIEMNGNVNG